MSPDKQNIAIAQACGVVSKDQWGALYKTEQGYARDCPDYLNDLNAMHEAEETAFYSDVLWNRRYARKLQEIVTRDFNALGDGTIDTEPSEAGWFCWWLGLHATAAQRAEAYVTTMEER
jgi:hypothetical protein